MIWPTSSIVRSSSLWTKLTATTDVRPSWYSHPALKLSWLIGLMAGSTPVPVSASVAASVPKLGMRWSWKPDALPQRSRPGMLFRFVVEHDIRIVERADVGLPDVSAERAARELVLRPVIVAAIAAEHLHTAVAKHVVRRSEPRRDLLAPAELDGDVPLSEGRDLFVLDAHAKVQRQVRPMLH